MRSLGKWDETGVYHVPLAVQCIYGWSDEGGEDGDVKRGVRFLEDGRGDCLVCCMQMTEFYMLSWRRT